MALQSLHSEKQKKMCFLLLFSRFFVTLEEFAGFLYIKEVWGTEEKAGYDLATVLNSAFCYKLHQRTPDAEPATIYDSSSSAKVIISLDTTKCYATFL